MPLYRAGFSRLGYNEIFEMRCGAHFLEIREVRRSVCTRYFGAQLLPRLSTPPTLYANFTYSSPEQLEAAIPTNYAALHAPYLVYVTGLYTRTQ